MKQGFSQAADAVLQGTVNQANGVPVVVAMATNSSTTIYEGAFGKRDLSQDAPHDNRHDDGDLLVHQSRDWRCRDAAG